jgi:OHCU decarboxylase
MNTNLALINAMPADLAEAALQACCGSAIWARRMTDARPFASLPQVIASAEAIWWDLATEDWQQAFAAHARIGGEKTDAPAQSQAWSAREQAGTAQATAGTLADLARGNEEYAARFGYIFIVCATGKSADEMLALLRARLHNDPESELKIAAAEQAKITRLRLEKFLGAAG